MDNEICVKLILKSALMNAVLIIGFYLLALLTIDMLAIPSYASPFWPPIGLAVAAVLRYGYRLLPGVFIAEFLLGTDLLGLATPTTQITVSVMALQSMLTAVSAKYLVNRYLIWPRPLLTLNELIRFFTLVAPVSMLLPMLLMMLANYFTGQVELADLPMNAFLWWTGGVTGIIVMLAVLMPFIDKDKQGQREKLLIVSLPLVVLTSILIALVYATGNDEKRRASYHFEEHIAMIHSTLNVAFIEHEQEVAIQGVMLVKIFNEWFHANVISDEVIISVAMVEEPDKFIYSSKKGVSGVLSFFTIKRSFKPWQQTFFIYYTPTKLFLERHIYSRIWLWISVSLLALSFGALSLLAFYGGRILNRQAFLKQKSAMDKMRLASHVFDSLEGIVIADKDMRVEAINNAYTRITGYNYSEVVGELPPLIDKWKASDEANFHTILAEIDQCGYWSGELVNKRKDGREYMMALRISKVEDEYGQLEHYISFFTDVTDEKESLSRLKFKLNLESVISEVSLNFITHRAEDYKLVFSAFLQKIGKLFQADRAEIYLIKEGNQLNLEEEWGLSRLRNITDKILIKENFQYVFSKLSLGRPVNIIDVQALPIQFSVEKQFYTDHNISAIIFFPIKQAGDVVGAYSLMMLGEPPSWKEDDIPMLMLMADILGLALERNKIENIKADSQEKTLNLLSENTMLLQKNKKLSRNLIDKQEHELRELALDLHDELGQHISAIKMDASVLMHMAEDNDEDMLRIAQDIDSLSYNLIQALRVTTRRLRTATLDHAGLEAALKEIVTDWSNRNVNVNTQLKIEGNFDDLGEAINITLYRILQESLTNVMRHAKATEVVVELVELPYDIDNRKIILTISDNGQGFIEEGDSESLGILGMKERAKSVGGSCSISKNTGEEGTKVKTVLTVDTHKLIGD